MPLSAEAPVLDGKEAEALAKPFVRTLVMTIRAHDTSALEIARSSPASPHPD